MGTDANKIRKQIHANPKEHKRLFLSTGSTLLNLACSGKVSGGLETGAYYLIVGDSSSGKSFLSLTCFAEAANNKAFDDYKFIYDDVENGALMDKERYFGKKAAKRIRAPRYKNNELFNSSTIEEFYLNVNAAIKRGKCIYVLDSMDALDTEEDAKRFDAESDGKKTSGSYGTAKAKKNSASLRVVINALKRSNSILIVISQTRDNIGYGAQFNPKTRSGGKALRFYATVEVWSSIGERITIKRSNGIKEKVGIVSKVQVKKNRIQGREPFVNIRILDEYGIDDIGSLCHFLVTEGHWSEDRKVINAEEFQIHGKMESIIKQIQDNGLENDLRLIAAEVWDEIEQECHLERKQRYE